jgi:hypothetical protein
MAKKRRRREMDELNGSRSRPYHQHMMGLGAPRTSETWWSYEGRAVSALGDPDSVAPNTLLPADMGPTLRDWVSVASLAIASPLLGLMISLYFLLGT